MTPQVAGPVLKTQPVCVCVGSKFQSVIAPLVRVRAIRARLGQEIAPEVNWFTVGPGKGLGNAFAPNVAFTPVVSKWNVIEPVRLVPNTAASAAALGLGRKEGQSPPG